MLRVCAALLVSVVIARALADAQSPAREDGQGLTGYVLTPDGAPASEGIIALQSRDGDATAAIDRTGRFSIMPHAPGVHLLHVTVPGCAPHRVNVVIPFARAMMLPPVRLLRPSYYRVRFITAFGEPLIAPHVTRQFLDVSGVPLREFRGDYAQDRFEPDGTLTVGPLPRGVMTLMLDMPALARTRLPDVQVGARTGITDRGTVIAQPGTTLTVDLVDERGAAVPNHEVYLEDAVPFSPGMLPPARTDQRGRVTFERLARGRYVLRTSGVGLCANRMVTIARTVAVSGARPSYTRLVIGGTVTLRLSSSGVPSTGTNVLLTAASAPVAPPAWLRAAAFPPRFVGRPFGMLTGESPCGGATDRNGRVTFENFPPGPARIDVRLPNSTWTRRLNVPADRRPVALDIPSGFMPLRVINARTRDPVPGAAITWTSRGGRVEATTSVSGDALLEGVAAAAGVLTIRARGYESLDLKQPAPSEALNEHELEPVRDASLRGSFTTDSGEPIADAVVELTPDAAMEIGQIVTTGSKGSFSFVDVPPGPVRLAARANGYVVSRMTVPADATGDITLTAARGYRIIARVESVAAEGQYSVRIVDASGRDMDDVLDSASDRAIDSPGRVSLGPLPPGTYTIELRGAHGKFQENVRIVDRDLELTLRRK